MAYEMRISDGSSDVCSSDLIAHPIDRDDLAGLDVERGRLHLAGGFARDEARQAVDHPGVDERRATFAEQDREAAMQLEHDVITEHRLHRGGTLAAAVRPHDDLGREQRAVRAYVPAARGYRRRQRPNPRHYCAYRRP